MSRQRRTRLNSAQLLQLGYWLQQNKDRQFESILHAANEAIAALKFEISTNNVSKVIKLLKLDMNITKKHTVFSSLVARVGELENQVNELRNNVTQLEQRLAKLEAASVVYS